nr:MAG TPA: minor capsid protein [Caudoviricetes sp.]
MAKSMVENGFSADQIRVEVMKMLRADKTYQMAVAENTMAYKREVQQIIDATVEAAKEAGDTLTAKSGNMAWNNDLSMWKQQGEDLTKPNSLSKFVKASSLQTSGALRNLTKTMGFKNTALGTTGVMNMYQREMDLALIKVSTGAFSFDQAVKDCVHRLAQSGLRSIDYESGRSYQLDVAARMAVRTGMSQLSGKITEENLKNSDHDLVITTQHMGSRPEHAVWQNKVFSYSGKSRKYPDFFKETGYGTVTGLKGANCTHDFYPYWEGASIIPEDIKEPAPRIIGGKTYTYYESTQKQRQMERQIRATKREIEATKSIGGDAQDLQNKLRGQLSDYTSFSKAAGLKERDNRLRVVTGTTNRPISRTKIDVNETTRSKKIAKITDESSKGQLIENTEKSSKILSTDKVIDIAKQFGDDILQGKDKLVFDNGNPIYDYVARKLKYDALPKIVDSASFAEIAKDSPIGVIYRGIAADTKEKAKQYAEEFMHGKMFAGKKYVYGSGTYFSPDRDVAQMYNDQGVMLKAILDKDAKIVNYEDIINEYSSTGADVAKLQKGNNTEAWEDILSTVGEFASIKGYDAINMNGSFGQNHVIVLNRGKVVIEE